MSQKMTSPFVNLLKTKPVASDNGSCCGDTTATKQSDSSCCDTPAPAASSCCDTPAPAPKAKKNSSCCG